MNNVFMPLNNANIYLNLRTLGPNYSTNPETYANKRIYIFEKNNIENNEPSENEEDKKILQYKKDLGTAFDTKNTLYYNFTLDYDQNSYLLYSYISQITSAISLTLESFTFINTNTNTYTSIPEDITFNHNKQSGDFTISIPNFDANETKVVAILKAVLDDTLILYITLTYSNI